MKSTNSFFTIGLLILITFESHAMDPVVASGFVGQANLTSADRPVISSENAGLTRSLTDASNLASSAIKIFFPEIDLDSTNLVTQNKYKTIAIPQTDPYSTDSDSSDELEPVSAESRHVSAFALHPKKIELALGGLQNIWLVTQDKCKAIPLPLLIKRCCKDYGSIKRLADNPEGTLLAYNISTGDSYACSDTRGFTNIYDFSQRATTHSIDRSAREFRFNGSGDKLVMIINEKVFLWDLKTHTQTPIMPKLTAASLKISRILNGNTFVQNFEDSDNNKSIIVWNSDNPSKVQRTKIDPSYVGITFGETTEQFLAYDFKAVKTIKDDVTTTNDVTTTDKFEKIFEKLAQCDRKILIVDGELMTSAQIPQTLPNQQNGYDNYLSIASQTYAYCPEIKKYFFINREFTKFDQLITINLLDPKTCAVQELEAFDPACHFNFKFSDDGKQLVVDKQITESGEYYIVNLIERYQDRL